MSRSASLQFLAGLLLLALTADAIAAPAPVKRRNAIMVDVKGRGIYVFDGDTKPGVSSCDSSCTSLWPPVYADADATPLDDFTVVARPDGRQQWAWRGKPLYRWLADRKRGDAGGDGVASAWHLVRLKGQDGAKIAPFSPAER